jgi:hypothetical protein
MGRTLAKTLRDLRNAYENLTRDLGPELMSIQETTQELRESVESITSIPQDMISSVVKAADLDDTIDDLKKDLDGLQEVGRTVTGAGKMIKDPVGAAVDTARSALLPSNSDQSGEEVEESGGKESTAVDTAVAAVSSLQSAEPLVAEEEPSREESAGEVAEAKDEPEERSDE